MTALSSKTTVPSEKETQAQTQAESEFDWRDCWYPVIFIQDLPQARPYSFSLYDEPFVLFKNQRGQLVCLTDRCPHRGARLSDGQIIDGQIECLYHGWQFGHDGNCVLVPQLPHDAPIPIQAGVNSFKVVEKKGLVWVWAGSSQTADESKIPTIPYLEQPGFVCNDKISDLPCDIGYVIEHMLDPAHIHIAHHGNQGNRALAQPLFMEVTERSIAGFRGRFRDTSSPHQTWRNLDFIVPSLAHLYFPIPERGWFFGQAFYFIPLGKGKTRILTRSYRNFATWQVKLMPRWWIHLKQNQILMEDLVLLWGQQQEVERLGKNLQEIYTPLPSCDTFVVEYRQWLDKYGYSLPFYRGYVGQKAQEPIDCSESLKSLPPKIKHTQLCSSCLDAQNSAKRLRTVFIGLALAEAAVAIMTDGWVEIATLSVSLITVMVAFGFENLKTKLESF